MGRLAELQRKLLEQLMGAEAMGIVQTDISIWDPKICRPHIAGICPHDLFTNTKMDLGACPRTHSVKVKNEYEADLAKAEGEKDELKIKQFNQVKADYENVIFQFVDECDRRIRAAQRRLEKTPEENNRTTALMREIGELEGAYQAAMADVEQLGSQGKVDESIAQLAKAEALKGEKQEKERELQNLTETSGASGHQKLRVCDICGAYLSVLDSDRRLADHFGGKMHLGYLQLRTLIDEWRARGPLPTAPPPTGAAARSSADSAAAAAAKAAAEAPAPVTFRPIPPSKTLRAAPPPSDRSDGDRDRDHRSSRNGGHSERDRDRGERSSRPVDEERRHSSSRRYDDDERRSSRRDEEAEKKSSRHSSSRRYDDDDRRSSRRDDDDDRRSSRRDEEKRSSSRRTYEDGEEREKEKRRRVD
ncbi:LUC7-domain-containing protein [Meredithblackwellia eburnea MCA 4105]